MTAKYEVTNEYFRNLNIIKILDGDFEGTEFILGEINFQDPLPNGRPVFHFDFTIVNNRDTMIDEDVRQTVGDIALDLIQKMVGKEEIIYTGGV